MRSRLNIVIKILILIGLFYAIYNQLFVNNDINQLLQTFFGNVNPLNIALLVVPLLLVVINWSLEASKWKYLIKKRQNISFLNALKATLSGLTLGLFTPNRIGEYGGRVLFLKKDKINGFILTTIGSYSQVTITLIAGLIALFFALPKDLNSFIDIPVYILQPAIIFLLGIVFLVYFNIHKMPTSWIPWKIAQKHLSILNLIRFKDLFIALLLSLFRFTIYTAQFLLLLYLLGSEFPILKGLMMISIIFLAQTIIPTIALAELGIRGNLSIFFLGMLTDNILAILLASTLLWIINLVIPSLAGLFFIWKHNFSKTFSLKAFPSLKRAFLLGLIIIVGFISAEAQSDCSIKNTAFNIGEELTYKVNYNWGMIWIGAGEVTFKVNTAIYDKKSVFHFTGIGQTYPNYDWFFKVRDRYESYSNRETLLPYRFIRDVKEGSYEILRDMTFDHKAKKAHTDKGDKDLAECTYDVVSVIYKSRNIDFSKCKVDEVIPINIFLDYQVYPIYIRYKGKETIKTKLGKFDCIKFKPLLVDGTLFEGGENMTVWVTDDANKIPIRVESPIIVGSIKVDLISYDNLRSDFTSKH